MQRIIFFVKTIVLAILICLSINMVSEILQPKNAGGWPSTRTFDGFYQMSKDSLDCIMFGSSHAVSFFSPQELYNCYGYMSYNLGSEQQNLLTSYYWLEEALNYQSPQVVILETFFLFPYTLGEQSEIVNFDEPSLRKAFDNMRLSNHKINAVRDICSIDKSQSASSYFFPMIRYHTRWNELKEEDFTYLVSDKYFVDKGYSFIDAVSNYEYIGYETVPYGEEQIPDNTLLYLEKIRELCEMKGIKLVLVTTPKNGWNENMHMIVDEYCKRYDLFYIDFCSSDLMQEINYCFVEDNADYGHGNIRGATKVTDYLGKYLSTYLLIEPLHAEYSQQWDHDKELYSITVDEHTRNLLSLESTEQVQ